MYVCTCNARKVIDGRGFTWPRAHHKNFIREILLLSARAETANTFINPRKFYVIVILIARGQGFMAVNEPSPRAKPKDGLFTLPYFFRRRVWPARVCTSTVSRVWPALLAQKRWAGLVVVIQIYR